ncbi:MAG: hypothetical protein AB1515_01580, partial [Nitrospirota bacterium]
MNVMANFCGNDVSVLFGNGDSVLLNITDNRSWFLAINLCNEEGLFADTFSLIDTMSTTGEIYSFFGKKFNLSDYELP